MRQPTFSKTSALGQWYGADKVVDYHVVDGVVYVNPSLGPVYTVAVSVPVEFVKFATDLKHTDGKIDLYLDQDDKRWIFGYDFADSEEGVDLWHYTANSFPAWASAKRAIR